jgi:caffeoyl-CoA O-methyltransferase
MTSGPLQGRLLKSFASIKGATRILEIGTFCGYSALSLAEGLGDGGTLVTLEIDPEAAAIATKHFALSPHGKKITLMVGPGMETLAKLAKKNPGGPFDLVFLDADKRSYRAYYDLLLSSDLLQKSALILADNVLFKGKVLNSAARAAGGQTKELNYWQRRHQDIADDLHDFNVYVNKDPRTEAVLLPLRDGLTVIRRV